jgi:hypothetical protein
MSKRDYILNTPERRRRVGEKNGVYSPEMLPLETLPCSTFPRDVHPQRALGSPPDNDKRRSLSRESVQPQIDFGNAEFLVHNIAVV